jgi:hypothetical protein
MKTLVAVSQCSKQLRHVSYRLLYRKVTLDVSKILHDFRRDPENKCLSGTLVQIQRYTKHLIVHAPANPDAEEQLYYIIGELGSASLKKLDLGGVPVSDRICAQLKDIMVSAGSAQLLYSLETINLPWDRNTTTPQDDMMDSLVSFVFEPNTIGRTAPVTVSIQTKTTKQPEHQARSFAKLSRFWVPMRALSTLTGQRGSWIKTVSAYYAYPAWGHLMLHLSW